MYALRRTFIAFIIFWLWGLALTLFGDLISGLLALLLGSDWRLPRDVVQGLAVLASFVFAVGYLIAGLFGERPSDDRPWRLVWILAGVNFIMFLGDASVVLVRILREDPIVFFHTPKELAEKHIPAGKRVRLGGLVAEGSLKRVAGMQVEFAITDEVKTIPVSYTGILPDLFREGQGVVVEGKLDGAGHFLADTVLAKHDENYMPLAKALKAQSLWKGASKKDVTDGMAKK